MVLYVAQFNPVLAYAETGANPASQINDLIAPKRIDITHCQTIDTETGDLQVRSFLFVIKRP